MTLDKAIELCAGVESKIFDILWEASCELAIQRAHEEGDVDIDRDYALMEKWEEEYFINFCNRYELDPIKSDYI